MANDLRFGIIFDLDKGIKEAIAQGDKGLRRLETAIAKHPITVKVKLDTGRTRDPQSELVGFRKQLAELTQQWNSLTAAERGSAAGTDLRQRFRTLREEAQGYTSSLQAAVKQEEKLAQTQKKTGEGVRTHSSYLSRLVQRMVAYASVSYVGNLLTQVRQVTAEFELQRISLGAIIQDQQRANQLFSEIKTFALKSPVKILDLTKYTKQLAAYKIGVDELFETTKRLTDISVGLGVSMDRIVLMYGQIRATGYLRASEVRQATEAGIPLVEELANKLSKTNGELVTAADVMDMISKRAISFEMVREVFDDMTSAGGIFYNMQEKQGNTLYGMWQKLGDAAAVMYDEIGNAEAVNEGMKSAIQSLRYLMLHWRQVGTVVAGISALIISNTVATKNNAVATAAATVANKQHVFSLNNKLNALRLEQANLKATSISQRIHTAATIAATKAQIAAANSTNIFSKALYSMKAALLSNPLTTLAVALTTIIAILYQAESEFDKLNQKLEDINRDYDKQNQDSVNRFKELVKAVQENVDGSNAQKDALEELNRTYGKILGSEALELESLNAMGDKYEELIDLIEAYNAKKKGEEKATAIKSSYATILDEEKDDLMDYLNAFGMSTNKQAEFISRLNEKILEGKDAVTATNETFIEFADELSSWDHLGNAVNITSLDKIADSWGVAFRQLGGLFGGQGMDYLYNYANALEEQNKALDENEKATRLAADACGTYSTDIDTLSKSLKNLDWSSLEALYNSLQKYNSEHPENMLSVPIDLTFDPSKADTEYEKMLEMSNMKINAIFSNIKTIAQQEGVSIPEEFYIQAKSVVDGNKDFSFINWEKLEKLPMSEKAKAALRAYKQFYEGIAPTDDTIRVFNRKFMELSDNFDIAAQKLSKYMMKSGDTLGDHRKMLSDEVTNLLKEIARLEWTKKMLSMFGLPADAVDEKIKESQETVKLLQQMIADIPDIEGIGKKSKGGHKSDDRLSKLKEIESTLATINTKYEELVKKEGQTNALEYVNKNYKQTLDYINQIAKQFKLNFEMPTEFKDLQTYRQNIIKVIRKLKMNGFEKAAIELELKIAEGNQKKLEERIGRELKSLADRITRTKTAKEFYEKILSQTGDVELAAKLSLSLYGENGEDLKKQVAMQINELMQSGEGGIEIGLDVINSDFEVNYKNLRKLIEEAYAAKKIGDQAYKDLVAIADNGEKDVAKMIDGWLKATEKAKGYSDKMLDLARTTNEAIAKIEAQRKAGNITDDSAKSQTDGLRKKQAEDEAKLMYEAFKDSPMYVQMFDDLDNASTQMLTNMKSRLEGMRDNWKNLDPTQLKELQSRLNEIDKQLAQRNPFKGLTDGIKQYRKLMKEGDGSTNNGGKGSRSYGEAGQYLIDTAKAADEARTKYEEILHKDGATKEEIAEAKKNLDDTMADETAAQKAVENWKKVKDAIGLSANELFTALNSIGDIAKGVATVMEAVGADENDVQYWNDISDALTEITSGIQGIVQSAMNGNVMGIVSSAITAIPNMFAGFVNLFSAGKIRKANKEIERQTELLEQLAYTYGRLEKAAEKAFGSDYINNFKARQKTLEAQAAAYQKQLEAEKSKGKKADEDKLKEYENAYRDTMDEIADMQGQIAAQMLGTDLTSAARDFAKAWLDAYKEFGNTAEAMSEKFKDMIENMVVEGALAKVMERALQPMFDMIDNMEDEDFYSESFWKNVVATAEQGAQDADYGAQTMMKYLEQAGISMRDLGGDLTGIKRDIATASEESITGLAGHMNTVEYYVSCVPRIGENTAAILGVLQNGLRVNEASYDFDPTEIWNKTLAIHENINQNTASILAENVALNRKMEKAVATLTAMSANLERVMVYKGNGYRVRVVGN